MRIHVATTSVPEKFQDKIVIFDSNETLKTKGGVEIKKDKNYSVVGYSSDNHAPIFVGVVVNESKNTLHVETIESQTDLFLEEYLTLKNILESQIKSLQSELEQLEQDELYREYKIEDLAIKIDDLKKEVKEQEELLTNKKKLIDIERRKKFKRWINRHWLLKFLFWLYRKTS